MERLKEEEEELKFEKIREQQKLLDNPNKPTKEVMYDLMI